MRYLLTALVLAAPLASGAAPANVCDVSDIIDCKALAKAPVDLSGTQGFPKFKDGRQIFNPLAGIKNKDSLEFLKSQTPTPKQLGDLKKNVALIKGRIRKFLQAGRSEEWIKKSKEPEAVELRAILKRLDEVKIRLAHDEEFECSVGSPLGFPNAYNELVRNSIMLCPATAKQSLPWLTRTIAHEIGHALGPCAMEKPLFVAKTPGDYTANSCFDTGGESEGTEEGFESSAIDKDIKRLIKSINSGDVTSVVGSRSRVGELVSCGMFDEAPEASVSRENRSMFGRVPQCIDSIYAAEHEAEIKKGVAQDLASGMTDPKFAERHRRSENPQACHSPAQEHFSDSFAARFTAHVAEEDNWSKNDVRISLIYDAVGVCAAQENRNYLSPALYPPAATRLSLALNEAVVRDRLKCASEPNVERLCSLPESAGPTAQSSKGPGGKPSDSSSGVQ